METRLPNDARARSHGEKTLDTIVHILTDQGLLRARSPSLDMAALTAAMKTTATVPMGLTPVDVGDPSI
jgi:hypothetical protein